MFPKMAAKLISKIKPKIFICKSSGLVAHNNPLIKTRLSPGRKKPKNNPVSAKIINSKSGKPSFTMDSGLVRSFKNCQASSTNYSSIKKPLFRKGFSFFILLSVSGICPEFERYKFRQVIYLYQPARLTKPTLFV